MANPNSLIPLKITQLPEDPNPSTDGWMTYVNNGVTYKVQVNALLTYSGVPSSRTLTASSGLLGGGDLSENRSFSVDFTSVLPAALGIATAGSSDQVSRGDHTHPALDLTDPAQRSGVLPLDAGGTNGNPHYTTLGGVVYYDGIQYEVTSSAGTAGQALLSTGGGEPAWGDVTVDLLNITGGIATPDWIQFDTAPTGLPTDAAGMLYWNDADGAQTLNLVMAGGAVVQQVGEELYYRVKASAAITNGDCVMFTGTVGQSGQITAGPATGLTGTQGNYVIGVATQDIAQNDWGYVTCFGYVRKIDTSAWAQGAVLYYDPAVAGGLTDVLPDAPNPKVEVAAVIVSDNNNGEVLVRVTHGSILGATDSNVKFSTLASGDFMIYNATAGYWVNNPITASTGISVTNGAGTVTIANTAPDQTVAITAGTGISATGTYPNFTITNTAPDQTVAIASGTGISATGTYPNFTVTNTAPDQTVAITAGTGISATGTYPNFTVTNTAPDQVVALTQGGTTTITGTYPNFTISSADQYTGTVTSVAATAGTGISVSGSPITGAGTLTITNTDTGSAQAIFKNIAVAGQSTVVADSNNDTLTLVAGSNVTITTDASTDAITISSSGGGGGTSDYYAFTFLNMGA